MSETIIPHAVERPRARVAAWPRRLARKAVYRRLGALAEGRLTIIDDEGTRTFGGAERGTLAATVRVGDPRFFGMVALGGSLGAAEAYIRGLWSCDDLPSLLRLFARNLAAADGMERGAARILSLGARLGHLVRRNTRAGSRRNIHAHYDLGNDFFELFLDETMTYSCGIFSRPSSTMLEASVEKLDRICRKLEFGPDDHVLEIGTGWGSFALHAAKTYGCRVTTTTISREQHELARRRVREAGLADRITLLLEDYRDLEGRFDKIASIEMIEAVGHAYLDTFLAACSRLLRPDGLMVIQAITMADQRYEQYRRSADFIQRYVFPGSCLVSMAHMARSLARATDLRMVHLEDITPHYVETLRRWRRRFADNADEVRGLGYPEELIRLWDFYLCYCEAGFAERSIGDVQVALAKPGWGRDG